MAAIPSTSSSALDLECSSLTSKNKVTTAILQFRLPVVLILYKFIFYVEEKPGWFWGVYKFGVNLRKNERKKENQRVV